MSAVAVQVTAEYIPRLQCELQGGHVPSVPIQTKNDLNQDTVIVVCVHCGETQN